MLTVDADDLSDCLRDLHRILITVLSDDVGGRSAAAMPRLRDAAVLGLRAAQEDTQRSRATTRSDVSSWLVEQNLDAERSLGPAFVQAELDVHFLDDALNAVGLANLGPVLLWLSLTVEAELLLGRLDGCLDWVCLQLRTVPDATPSVTRETALLGLHDVLTTALGGVPRRDEAPPGDHARRARRRRSMVT